MTKFFINKVFRIFEFLKMLSFTERSDTFSERIEGAKVFSRNNEITFYQKTTQTLVLIK